MSGGPEHYNKPENDEKKEIKFEVGKIEIEKDSKETVVGRKGCVNEGQTEPKEFTNNDLMTMLEGIVESNTILVNRFNKLWERIEWLEQGEKIRILKKVKEETQYQRTIMSAEDIGKEVTKIFADLLYNAHI